MSNGSNGTKATDAPKGYVEARGNEIKLLSTMQQVAAAPSAVQKVDCFMVPLLEGSGQECCFDEATTAAAADAKVDVVWATLMLLFQADSVSLESVTSRSALSAVKSKDRNGRDGRYKIRIVKAFWAHFKRVVEPAFVVTQAKSSALTHKWALKKEYFPAKIVNKIWQQHGLAAAVGFEFEYSESRVYKVVAGSEEAAELVLCAHWNDVDELVPGAIAGVHSVRMVHYS